MNRRLVSSSALLWGLQLAFLTALALILVELYGATTAEVGWVLALYNAGGFLASLLVPAYADRRQDYLDRCWAVPWRPWCSPARSAR